MDRPPTRNPRLTDVVRYLARPRFSARREAVDLDGLRHLISLFFATALAIVIISPVIGSLLVAGMGGALPRNANESLLDMNPGQLVLIGIILAPLIEEAIFRSWLGFPRLSLAGLPVLSVLMAWLAMTTGAISGAMVLPLAAVLGFLLFVCLGRVFRADTGALSEARARLFPAIFWGSALLFALLHLANFENGLSSPWLLLAVVPQGLVGLVLGYVRMRFGLVSAVFFHGAYNALFLSLGLLAAGMTESAAASTVWRLLF